MLLLPLGDDGKPGLTGPIVKMYQRHKDWKEESGHLFVKHLGNGSIETTPEGNLGVLADPAKVRLFLTQVVAACRQEQNQAESRLEKQIVTGLEGIFGKAAHEAGNDDGVLIHHVLGNRGRRLDFDTSILARAMPPKTFAPVLV